MKNLIKTVYNNNFKVQNLYTTKTFYCKKLNNKFFKWQQTVYNKNCKQQKL